MSMKHKKENNSQSDDLKQDEQKPIEQINQENSEIETLKNEIEILKDSSLRQLAEFDNFRKRTSREKVEIYSDSIIKTVSGLLGVIDNFERALNVECKDEDFKKGMEMIFNQLKNYLQTLEIVEIEAKNKQFDPNFHYAVNKIEDEGFDENTVCEVLQKGYMLGEKVIRHAMVVVAN